MDLNFITELKDEELVELINFCIQRKNQRYQEEGIRRSISPIKQVVTYREANRKDLNGNRYFWVGTADGAKILSTYRIKDFEMSTDDVGHFGRYTAIDYTSDMRIFMAKRFGPSYVKAVYDYQVLEAEKELTRLSAYIEDEKRK